jgi:hypothetical protein
MGIYKSRIHGPAAGIDRVPGSIPVTDIRIRTRSQHLPVLHRHRLHFGKSAVDGIDLPIEKEQVSLLFAAAGGKNNNPQNSQFGKFHK